MESKKINQLATELAPVLSDLTIIGDPTTGISRKITLSQMASLFTGTVEEYPNLASFPLVGTADTIYIALDTNVLYRWNTGTNAYVELSPNIINSLVFNDANGFDGTISLVGSTATLTITTALTTGSVGFIGASGALLQDNANFFWNNSTKRLGINTNAPTTAIDTFGSGIITRVNGTSTNNAFIGFASAGTNRWSIGNVQSDHRFRIYNEATTSELVSVLSTGEFGIGIANPTTKIHIDGGASALIANLDANVSVAKSLSFRSDNSNRINLEVSGTESGSNAGANFFIRRYSDAGALIDTPLTITRSTGAISLATALSGTTASFTGLIRSDLGTTGSSGIFTGTNSNLQINHDGTTAVNLINTGGGGYIFKASDATSTIFSLSNAGVGTFTSSSTSQLVLNGGATVATRLLVTRGSDDTNQNLLLGYDNITVQRLNIALSSSQTAFSINQQGSNGTRTPFQVSTAGFIGINTTSADTLLTVDGQVAGFSTTNIARFYASKGNNDGSYLQIQGTRHTTASVQRIVLDALNGAGSSINLILQQSAGNVGIGMTDPQSKLHIISALGANVISIGESGNNTRFAIGQEAGYTGNYINSQNIDLKLFSNLSGGSGGNIIFYTGSSGTNIERSRYTSSGFFKATNDGTYFGSTGTYHELRSNIADFATIMSNTASSPSGLFIQYVNSSPNSAGNAFLYCRDSGLTVRAEIRSNGGLANFQANNVNLSDERTKKDIIPLESYWNKFKAIEIVKFKYKDQTHDDFNIGVIAQQVEKVAPEFIDIDGWNNKPELDEEGNEIISQEEPLKSVYTADLHHATIKVLQEAMAKIESLEKEVELLKSK